MTYKAKINAQKTLNLLRNVAFELELQVEIQRKAAEFICKYFLVQPDSRTSPEILISALLYHAGKITNRNISRTDLCRVLDVSPKWAASQYRGIVQKIDKNLF
ncbi:MAG: cyclin family protein [Candidatus Hodarchaeota archaeon]